MDANKQAMPEASDPDDAPELTDAFFEQADEYVGDKLVRRGRPKGESPKLALTTRDEPDIVEAFKTHSD